MGDGHCDGNKAEVEVYAPANSAGLLLNGKSLSRKEPKECKTMFVPGTLEAVVWADKAGTLKQTGDTKIAVKEA